MWPVRLYKVLPHCLKKGRILEKNILEHKMCVFILSIPFVETFIILRIERVVIKIVKWFSCKVPVILVGF